MKLKPLIWVGSSKSDLLDFPEDVIRSVGFHLRLAQEGAMGVNCKILKGFGGAGVIEIKENDPSGTFRVVYTIKLGSLVFVLHSFQKKSKQGIGTPKKEINLVEARLKLAQQIYKDLGYGKKEK